jgi:ATP-dependent HslUV protease subunit HslV
MQIKATTILAVKHKGVLVFAGDGQVTFDKTVMKQSANKIRTLQDGRVLAGFAGSAADSFTLFERFEGKLKEHGGQLGRASVELAREWRSDRYLRRLEAMMVVGDSDSMYLLSGAGDVIQPDDGVLAIGSGGNFAMSAAKALLKAGDPELTARKIAEVSMGIAAEICVYTNNNFVFQEIS